MHGATIACTPGVANRRRDLLVAFLLSAVLHLLLISQITPQRPLERSLTRSLDLTVVRRPPDTAPVRTALQPVPSVAEPPRAATGPAQPAAAGEATAPDGEGTEHPDSPLRPGVAPVLDLSPARLREIAREIVTEPPDPVAGDSPGLGRVFDPRLLTRLQSASQRSALSRRGGAQPAIAASSATDPNFLKIDGMCFRVLPADPLLPLSVDTWYREPCPAP